LENLDILHSFHIDYIENPSSGLLKFGQNGLYSASMNATVWMPGTFAGLFIKKYYVHE